MTHDYIEQLESVVRGLSRLLTQAEQAFAIADSCARSDIESWTQPVLHQPGEPYKWWDLESAVEIDAAALAESVRYLEARGLLVRHPNRPNIVSFRSSPSPLAGEGRGEGPA